MTNQFRGIAFISAMRFLSSRIAVVDINPLYKNNGNPSSTSEFLSCLCPSLN